MRECVWVGGTKGKMGGWGSRTMHVCYVVWLRQARAVRWKQEDGDWLRSGVVRTAIGWQCHDRVCAVVFTVLRPGLHATLQVVLRALGLRAAKSRSVSVCQSAASTTRALGVGVCWGGSGEGNRGCAQDRYGR